jgi:uncharacterized surface protein with fasciclin (FAS1) repeats
MKRFGFFPAGAALVLATAVTFTTMGCGDDDPIVAPEKDIVTTAQEAGSFNTLLAAVDAAGLTSTLTGGGPFTVFAPTDAAFDALPAGTLDALLADKQALTDVLLYHVVSGSFLAADLQDRAAVTTAQGQDIAITLGSVKLNGVTVGQADIKASNGVIHVIDQVLLPPSMDVVGIAADNADFSTLVTAVQAAGLVSALQGPGPFTVFAPTNAAFAALPSGTLDALLADPQALAEVLKYHVVSGKLYAGDLRDTYSAQTLAGFPILFPSLGAQVNNSLVGPANILATNGVIHVIDQVLLPPSMDIVETATAAGFTTLATAIEAAGLVSALKGPGPFTVFAPTEDAFGKLTEGALETLLANPDQLAQVLLYHVVDGRYFSADVARESSLTTLQGTPVTVSTSGEVLIENATVTSFDVITTNGVIHVIDTVLIP